MLAALWLGGARVIVGVVVAEMLISPAASASSRLFPRIVLDTPRVFAGVPLVLLITAGSNAGLPLAERRCAV